MSIKETIKLTIVFSHRTPNQSHIGEQSCKLSFHLNARNRTNSVTRKNDAFLLYTAGIPTDFWGRPPKHADNSPCKPLEADQA